MNSESQRVVNWTQLLRQAYGFFRERFEEYFPFVLGSAVVAGAAYYGLEQLRIFLVTTVPIHHSVFDESPPSSYFHGMLMGWLLWCLQILVCWIAMTCIFACVAVKMLGSANETSSAKVPAGRAFRRAMTQFHKLGGLALVGTLATIVFSSFMLPVLLRVTPFVGSYLHFHYGTFFLAYSVTRRLLLIIFGVLLCTITPAIPTLIANPGLSVPNAIGIGLKHTREQRPFIAIWLSASAVCGSAACYIAADLVQAACRRGDISGLCSFFQMLVTVFVISLLAGPTFIGLTFLSLEDIFRKETSAAAPAH